LCSAAELPRIVQRGHLPEKARKPAHAALRHHLARFLL